MNKLEILQEVYGKDYVFTETELSRLLKVTELIVRECVEQSLKVSHRNNDMGSIIANMIKQHFGVEE
jgi:plasmid maintenance system antidote protein VapI